MAHQGILGFELHRIRERGLHPEFRNESSKRQLKEGMNGYSSGVQGSDSCWRNDHRIFMRGLHDFTKQGRFSCPGFACQENGLIRLVNKMLGKIGRRALFWIQFGLHLFEVTKIVRMKK